MPVRIVTFVKSLGSHLKEYLSEILRNIELQNKRCFLMGDFNIDLLNTEVNQHANDFLNNMLSSSFYPLISRPTRITCNSATLIDNILFC